MDNWFTIDKIDNETIIISEYRHWEETHCYLLNGKDKSLLIDTGLGISNIYDEVRKLTDKPIAAVATHIHWDHIGGHKYFEDIAVHEAEKDWLSVRFPIPLQVVKRNLLSKPCDFPKGFMTEDYQIFKGMPQHVLHDGDCLDLGNRKLKVIHTPGHSPGHCCFYEPDKKYLFSGDLIYEGCLDAFYPSTDPQLFFQSVRKIQNLSIERILPGHHQLSIPVDLIDRINNGFSKLSDEGKLKQGSGVFDFGDFQIHI